MLAPDLAVLMVPGYTGSGPGHWQTLWEREHPGVVRVEQTDWDRPELNDWVKTLHRFVHRARAPVVLVGHSCGAATIVHWAARYGPGPVAATLLVAPADADAPDALEAVRAFAPLPTERLPFPTVLVASDDDAHLGLARARGLARGWGSRLIVAHGAGHLNAASGHGPWPEGKQILADLAAAIPKKRPTSPSTDDAAHEEA